MEIQREAIIEIVGTQYEGRAVNHNALSLQQSLIFKHQTDNPYDHNAVLLLTEDGKELGFLPKGYASLYAPAIDSGRYTFSIEIVKTEPDPKRPILIIKIISELSGHSEEEIESDIIGFVQNIVNGYALKTKEYLAFVYAETVNMDDLLSVLDSARLIQKLLSCANDIIENRAIKPNSDKFTLRTKEDLTQYLNERKTDVRDVLKKIQKAYNESLDIDDEEEYHRVQSEVRERRKKFRQYDNLLISLLDIVTSYVNIATQAHSPALEFQDNELERSSHTDKTAPTVSEPEKGESVQTIEPSDVSRFTEQAFFDWLVSDDGVSDLTAKQYISNIHSIEKLYQTLFGIRQNILGTFSTDSVRSMIEVLIQRSEYIDANERRHNSFDISLSKFTQFAGISVVGLKNTTKKKNYQPSVDTQPCVIRTVNFDNPQNCTYHKPCSFLLNEQRYAVGSWQDLYKKFLNLLYTNNTYSEVIKGLNNKVLYGRHIDFADKTLVHKLRKPITVSTNFFAEGNLSAADIIKHIKYIMEFCSIDNEHMIVEYSMQKNYQPSVDTQPCVIRTVNFDNPQNCTYHKPCSFLLNEQRYAVGSWQDLYKKFLNLLYTNNIYSEVIKGLNNKVLYGRHIDFADKTRIHKLRTPIMVSTNFFAEGNLSAADIIKHIKCIMEFCSIDNEHMVIEYSTQENEDDTKVTIDSAPEQKNTNNTNSEITETIDAIFSEAKTSITDEERTAKDSSIECPANKSGLASAMTQNDSDNTSPEAVSFIPNHTKSFVLKDAIIEILLTNAPEVTKYHEYKGGISSKSLRELIKKYYGKMIGLFEISKLLMSNKTFRSVGKGCYIINETAIPHNKPEPEFPENDEPVEIVTKPVRTPETTAAHEMPTVAAGVKTMTKPISTATQTAIHKEIIVDDKLTIAPIIEVMKENYNNLQYEDGFGAYEVKNLLSQKGYTNVSEDEIDAFMSKCPELQKIEEGYYTLAEIEDGTETTAKISDSVENKAESIVSSISAFDSDESQQVDSDARDIVLRLDGNTVRAYDYSDALGKICEFSINCKPFKMARIAGQGIQIHGNNVFYRKSVPVNGYSKLSNGLQVIMIAALSDLQAITAEIKKYCQIDNDMITIIVNKEIVNG